MPYENNFYCNNVNCQQMKIAVNDIIYVINEINCISTVRKIFIKCKMKTKCKNTLFCMQCLIALKQLVAKLDKKKSQHKKSWVITN